MTGPVIDDAGERTVTTDRRARTGATAFYLVQGLCFAGLLAQVPTLQDGLGMSDGTLTIVLLLVPVVAGAGSVLAGTLAPRTGSAALLRVAGPLVAVAVLGTALAPSTAVLLPVVAVVGLLLGVVDATMNMQGVAVERRYRRSLLNSFHGAWSVGGILGSLAAVLAHSLDWGLVAGLGLVAAVAVVVDLVAAPLLPAGRAQDAVTAASGAGPGAHDGGASGVGGEGSATPVPWRPILLVGTAVAIVYLADSAASSWSTKYISDVLHSADNVAPLGLAAYLGCQLLGRLAADGQVNRFGPVRPVAVGGIVGAAGLGLVAVAPTPWVAVVGFGLTGLGLSVVVPLSFSVAGALDTSGVAVARVNLFNYVGFVLGAGVIGGVAELADLRWAFAVPAVLALGVVALAPAYRVAARRETVPTVAARPR
ncbi:MFS transporter [Isoptericola aurantiacus]|uniref:MFS transporter n=1 Tax=Isoptericola aurantiacus TaxID=3377839 RepID=UPI00383AC4C3